MRLRPGRGRGLAAAARTAALGAAVLVALGAAGAAEAQVNLAVSLTPSTPPVVNAVSHGLPSSISLDVANSRAGTRLRQLEFRLPFGYTSQGGVGPPGWTVTRIQSVGWTTIRFRVADCAQDGITSGGRGTFRIDLTSSTWTGISGDVTDTLSRVTPSDPCGGPTGWTVTPASSITWARKALLVTGTVSPPEGAPPLAAIATYTVRNLSNGTRTGLALQPSTSPTVAGTCTPATFSLAAGASTNVTCAYTLGSAGTTTFAATASGNGASAVGAVAGTVVVATATATFGFDDRAAGPGDRVRATLTVRNHGPAAITVTPPAYAALALVNLARAAGTADPDGATVAPGGSRDFVYALDVTGAVGATYVARGTAQTSAGPTNLAVTPAGTVSASLVTWTPPAVVPSRTAAPYVFTVTVRNGSAAAVDEIRIVNPQNAQWTGMASSGTSSPLTYQRTQTSGGTTTLMYTGTLAPGATATLRFSFSGVPAVTRTTHYPFQVLVYPAGGGSFYSTHAVTAAVAVPIPDVEGLTVLSTPGGQILAWTNTARADAPHEGVVVFRRAAPGVPTLPADFVDYGVAANRPADFFYEDGEGSDATTLADPATGAWNYRVCNRDPLFVYSNCSAGFWNGEGWLDSVPVPAGGWAHQLGGVALLHAGVIPGNRVGVATNAPSIAVLDLATGDRTFDPVPLAALPSNGTPAAQIEDGRLLLFAADVGGNVRALDLDAGALAWSRSLAGQTFVGGPLVVLRAYASAAFRAAYPHDVLLIGSTQGRLHALHAGTGAVLWTVDTGAAGGVRARVFYDYAANRLFLSTDGGGIRAYDLGTSAPSTPPAPLAGFTNPGGTYRLTCARVPFSTADVACVDTAGVLRVLDQATGAVRATLATGAGSPSTLAGVGGASPGFVVSNASRVVRVRATGTPYALSIAGTYAPGLTLSPSQTLAGEGAIVVAGSDGRLHRLSLADASDTGASLAISTPVGGVLLGPPVVDTVNELYVFGTDDGRVWAVPFF